VLNAPHTHKGSRIRPQTEISGSCDHIPVHPRDKTTAARRGRTQ